MNAKTAQDIYRRISDNMHSVIIGQDDVLESVIMTVMCNAHSIITGVPGLAKTLIVKLMAMTMDIEFNRVQFTPDLMPSDITGTVLIKKSPSGEIDYGFVRGPVFCNILLADEINRTPPKTQSALLQAMEERFVSVEGEHYSIEKPFHVFATQNPIEQEGTYPLPEAQIDRFMLKLVIAYPDKNEEKDILKRVGFETPAQVRRIISVEQISAISDLIKEIYMDAKLMDYIVDIVFATRKPQDYGIDMASYIQYGASPRATIFLSLAARAYAFLQGRAYVTPQDVKMVAPDVLRHRIIVSYEAEAEDVTSEQIIANIFDSIQVP